MNFTYKPVNTGARILLYLKKRAEKGQVHELILPLKIFAIVPLDNRIFQFTDPISITVNFEDSIDDSPLFTIIAIS